MTQEPKIIVLPPGKANGYIEACHWTRPLTARLLASTNGTLKVGAS